MEDGGPTATILIILLVLLDMLYCGFSATVDQLNVKEIERKAQEEKERKSIRLLKLIQNPQRFLDAFHTVTTMIHIGIGWGYMNWFVEKAKVVLGQLTTETFQWSVASEVMTIIAAVVSFGLVLYILLLVGITLPKKITLGNPERWAYAFIDVIYVLNILFLPITGLVSITARGIMKLLGLNPENDEGDVTEEEIIHMVNEGQEQGLIEAGEAEMISNIFEYHDKEAQDIMTHRNQIIGIEASMLLGEAIEFVLENRHSRYLVYEENIDHIIGILHMKDIMRYHADTELMKQSLKNVQDLLRAPEFVPLTRNIHELFKDMQSNKLQMVIVIDEYGQTAGLVAMEDILEEIVGNILDEYDEEEEYIEEKGEDEYIIEGKTPLEELEDRFHISFDEEEFETLNGFLIAKMDKIPEENEEFEVIVDGYLFKLLTVQNKMIQSVLVKKLPQEISEDGESILEEKTD
ncbi:MAG: HlyC/CorC family transporter [Lachnospiraceae bacterium]|nr:HlyC/CorC family transporter [Lachnospiraceae bacterium]